MLKQSKRLKDAIISAENGKKLKTKTFLSTPTAHVQENNVSPLSGIFDSMLIFGVTFPSLETSRDQRTRSRQLGTSKER